MLRVTTRLRFIEPQLASPVDQPPEGKHWIHEIKHDGYRSQVVIERGQARVFTRNRYDWSDRYPSIVRAAASLHCKSAIIDGEAIVQNGDGASDFEALQSKARARFPWRYLEAIAKIVLATIVADRGTPVAIDRRQHCFRRLGNEDVQVIQEDDPSKLIERIERKI